jgi:hypothetical protein
MEDRKSRSSIIDLPSSIYCLFGFSGVDRHQSAATAEPRESEYLPQRRKGRKEKEKYLSGLGVLRALAGGISEFEMFLLPAGHPTLIFVPRR